MLMVSALSCWLDSYGLTRADGFRAEFTRVDAEQILVDERLGGAEVREES